MFSLTEIMLFNKPPVDNLYDYIQMVPLLKEHRESIDSQDEGTAADDSSDSDYEVIDPVPDKVPEVRDLSHRYEPIAFAKDMDPIHRLRMLKNVYETGILPPDTDPVEEPTPTPEEQPRASSPGPPVPRRGTRLTRRQPPPPLPKPAKPIRDPNQPASPVRSPYADVEQWHILHPGASTTSKPSAKSVIGPSSAKPRQQNWYTKSPAPADGVSKKGSARLAEQRGCSLESQDMKHESNTNKPQGDGKTSKDKNSTHSQNSPSKASKQQRIKCLEDIPSDISELSVFELLDCMRLLNMEEHVPAFERSLVDGQLLGSLTEDLLIENFNFNKFDANKLICFSKGWRPKLKPTVH